MLICKCSIDIIDDIKKKKHLVLVVMKSLDIGTDGMKNA